jgi:hypothetical protein
LPAPFSPISARTSPAFTAKETSARARVLLQGDCHAGGLFVRAAVQDDLQVGLELRLEPPAGRLRLVRHDLDGATVLAEVGADVVTERWMDVRILVTGARVRVWLDQASEPLLDVPDAAGLPEGRVGVRACGGALLIDELAITSQGRTAVVPPEDVGSADRRALESLCLLVLNLNEFVFTD